MVPLEVDEPARASPFPAEAGRRDEKVGAVEQPHHVALQSVPVLRAPLHLAVPDPAVLELQHDAALVPRGGAKQDVSPAVRRMLLVHLDSQTPFFQGQLHRAVPHTALGLA
jgi:hypothetical protein